MLKYDYSVLLPIIELTSIMVSYFYGIIIQWKPNAFNNGQSTHNLLGTVPMDCGKRESLRTEVVLELATKAAKEIK